jgi:hypothetical protein
MDTPEVEMLFAQTLLGDYESEGAWAAVTALRQDGSRAIFEHAAAWCLSDDPGEESARGDDFMPTPKGSRGERAGGGTQMDPDRMDVPR